MGRSPLPSRPGCGAGAPVPVGRTGATAVHETCTVMPKPYAPVAATEAFGARAGVRFA